MSVSLADMKTHLGITPDMGDADDAMIQKQLGAAGAHVARLLGFALDHGEQFPNGTPADIDQAVKLLAAHWYENREATLVGVSAEPIPFGVIEIVREYRTFTYG
jgi:hypothetical protein